MPANCTGDRRCSEEGFTLLEVCVYTLLLGIVMSVVLTSLISIQDSAARTDHRSQTADQVRLGVQQLVQQINSANYLYDPSTEYGDEATPAGPPCTSTKTTSCVPQPPTGIPGGFSFRAYTQLNGVNNCVQWRVWNLAGGGELQFRSWLPSDTDSVTSWLTVAGDIVNPTTSPPFVLDPQYSGDGQSRLIDIDLEANSDTQKPFGSYTSAQETSVNGRDIELTNTDPVVCDSVPSP